MYGGNFVDIDRLNGDGGYITNTPYLFDANYTKEKFIEVRKQLGPIIGYTDEQYKNLEHNLKDCEMVDVELVIVNTGNA